MSTPTPAAPPVVGLGRVPAVAAAPRRQGALLTATGAVMGDYPDVRWEQGVIAWPEAAPGWRLVTDGMPEQADGDPVPASYGLGDGAAPVGARPYLVQTLTRCPRTSDLEELYARAERQLDAVTSQAIAREVWTGALTTAAPWALPGGMPFELANPRSGSGTDSAGPWLNPHFAAAAAGGVMVDPAEHPAAAVGRVEAVAMDRMAGGPVFIHVPPMWLFELSQFGIHPDPDTGRLTTPLGNVVVADAGYGSAVLNDSAAEAAYATGPMQVWTGGIDVLRDPSAVVELGTNALGVWAERPACHLFDPQTLVGCEVAP